MAWNNGITEGLSGSLRQIPKLREVPMQHKSCWQEAAMNRRAIFSRYLSSAAGGVPRWGRPDNFRRGRRQPPPGTGGDGSARARGSHWASASSSEVGPSGRQMEDYMRGTNRVPAAPAAAPEESTSWALNHPESSGFCLCRSHQ